MQSNTIDKKKKKILKYLIIGLLIIIVIILNIINNISAKNKTKTPESTENNMSNSTNKVELDTRTEEEKNTQLINKLKKASESDRIKTYLGTYFKYIENKNYEKAYDLLYDDFKKNYFPTIDDFEKYIKNINYPELITVNYEDIENQGKYYIVTVGVGDLQSKSRTLNKKEKYVLVENDYNDYYISFQM